ANSAARVKSTFVNTPWKSTDLYQSRSVHRLTNSEPATSSTPSVTIVGNSTRRPRSDRGPGSRRGGIDPKMSLTVLLAHNSVGLAPASLRGGRQPRVVSRRGWRAAG